MNFFLLNPFFMKSELQSMKRPSYSSLWRYKEAQIQQNFKKYYMQTDSQITFSSFPWVLPHRPFPETFLTRPANLFSKKRFFFQFFLFFFPSISATSNCLVFYPNFILNKHRKFKLNMQECRELLRISRRR